MKPKWTNEVLLNDIIRLFLATRLDLLSFTTARFCNHTHRSAAIRVSTPGTVCWFPRDTIAFRTLPILQYCAAVSCICIQRKCVHNWRNTFTCFIRNSSSASRDPLWLMLLFVIVAVARKSFAFLVKVVKVIARTKRRSTHDWRRIEIDSEFRQSA